MEGQCIYCHPIPQSETILWQNKLCRVILDDSSDFTGWCKVVWYKHIAELSMLTEKEATYLIKIIRSVELVLREILKPDKINIASLGTALPHLHWHIIPRYSDDSRFPEPIWSNYIRSEHKRVMDTTMIQLIKKRIAEECSHFTF